MEYKNVEPGSLKIYTHEIFYVFSKDGKILQLRASFDEERLFIRSAAVLKPEISFDGKAILTRKPIEHIISSDKGYEEFQVLGDMNG